MGLFATGIGFAVAWTLYGSHPVRDPLPERLGVLARWMRDKFYFDEVYAWLIRWTHDVVAGVADWVDRWIVAGMLVRGLAGATDVVAVLCGWY
jgi:NADH:ubiquinone oxidoreductase subunit 5 (subunit L)/multisubunit Na+/H+ antiporter MnhA subunit